MILSVGLIHFVPYIFDLLIFRGFPSVSGHGKTITWPKYESSTQKYLSLRIEPKLGDHYRTHKVAKFVNFLLQGTKFLFKVYCSIFDLKYSLFRLSTHQFNYSIIVLTSTICTSDTTVQILDSLFYISDFLTK